MERRFLMLIIWGAVVLASSGCATSQTSHYYLLGSMSKVDGLAQGEEAAGNISLGIGPITLPKYLERPQIVTRASSNALKVAEFDRWAEQLDHNMTRVVAENLSRLLGTNLVTLFPWNRQTPIDYQLIMEVLQFDRSPDGMATLLSRWHLLDGSGLPLMAGKKSLVTAKPGGDDYESLAKALSETLASFSREVAAQIISLAAEKKGE